MGRRRSAPDFSGGRRSAGGGGVVDYLEPFLQTGDREHPLNGVGTADDHDPATLLTRALVGCDDAAQAGRVEERENGEVSLIDGLERISDIRHVTQSSPPVVYKDLVIVGSQVPDRVQLPDPVG